jgi:hypothetical protein
MINFLATGGIYNLQHEERTIKVCLIEFGEKFLPKGERTPSLNPTSRMVWNTCKF